MEPRLQGSARRGLAATLTGGPILSTTVPCMCTSLPALSLHVMPLDFAQLMRAAGLGAIVAGSCVPSQSLWFLPGTGPRPQLRCGALFVLKQRRKSTIQRVEFSFLTLATPASLSLLPAFGNSAHFYSCFGSWSHWQSLRVTFTNTLLAALL